MAAEVGGLLINLGLDVAQIKQDVGKAQRELSGFRNKVDRQMGRAQKAVGRLTSGFKGLAAAVGAQQLGSAIGRTLSSFEEINRQARSLGASTQTIQELQFAFRQFGLEQKDVTDALATISDRADDALGGMQSFIDDFERFGIEVDSLRGKSPGQLFNTVAEGISNLDSEQKQVTAAVRLFGDEVGQRLLPLLQKGREGIDQYADRARELGVVVSDELVKDSAQAAKDFRALNEVLTAQFASAVAENADSFATLAKALTATAVIGADAAASVSNLVAEFTKFQVMGKEKSGARKELEAQREELQEIGVAIGKFREKLAEGDLSESARSAYQEGLNRQLSQLEKTKNRIITLQNQIEIESDRARDKAAKTGGGEEAGSVNDRLDKTNQKLEFTQKQAKETQRVFDEMFASPRSATKERSIITAEDVLSQNNVANKIKKTTEATNDLTEAQKELNRTNDQLSMTFSSAFEDAIVKGESLRSVVQGLVQDLARIALRKTVTEPAGNAFASVITSAISGATTSSTTSGALSSVSGVGGATPRSFAGGGYTGNGSRTGGVDGQGGFPAILHPRETVTDNTMGRSGGDVYNIDARGADQGQIARLEQEIKRLNGSVERRAITAVNQQRIRRPSR